MKLFGDLSIIGKFVGIKKTSSGKYNLYLEVRDNKFPIEVTEDFAKTKMGLKKGEVISALVSLYVNNGKFSIVLEGLTFYTQESTN